MEKQTTINQHYVPRFYMKNFSEVKNEETNKEKALISFYQFDKMIYIEKIPTKSICCEKYFYDEDGHIENKLTEKESIWSKSIAKAKDNKNISKLDMNNILEFFVYQIIRTKAQLKHSQKLISMLKSELMSECYQEIDKSVIRENVEKEVKDDVKPEDVLSIADRLIIENSDLDVIIINNKTNIPFITSDVPVIYINPIEADNTGLSNIGEVIFCPISESKLVMFYDKKIYDKSYIKLKSEISEGEEEIIHNFNKYQYISANERIMSLECNVFDTYIKDKDLNDKRKEFNTTKRVNSVFDGNGILLATKSRGIKYCYDINILKLPRQLRKIPEKFRRTAKRKYSKENREKFLFSIYRMPDLARNEDEKQCFEQLQKYSKRLLEYFDYYWKTPKEDCTISGRDMDLLKTYPAKRFEY